MPFAARALAASCLVGVCLSASPAYAQADLTPEQHKSCAVNYTFLRSVIDNTSRAAVLFERYFASMESYRRAENITREQTVERVKASAGPRMEAYSAGRLTREKAVADVQACDELYGYSKFVPI